jgi:hypothetical protein
MSRCDGRFRTMNAAGMDCLRLDHHEQEPKTYKRRKRSPEWREHASKLTAHSEPRDYCNSDNSENEKHHHGFLS